MWFHYTHGNSPVTPGAFSQLCVAGVNAGVGHAYLLRCECPGENHLLEAVYAVATGHSARTNQEGELIAWEADIARVIADFASTRRGALTIELSLGRKGDAAKGRAAGRRTSALKSTGRRATSAELAGVVPVVLFLVDDLEIIRGEPARRRAFLDRDLSAMSRTYAWTLRQYSRVVEQRNRLLKDIRDGMGDADSLPPWTAQLAAFGGRLLEVRTRFLGRSDAGDRLRYTAGSPIPRSS